MEEEKTFCFNNFTKVEPLKSELIFYQSNRDKNNSELVLIHPNINKIGHLISNEKGEIKTNSSFSYRKLNNDKFNPYKLDKKFISQGIDVFVIGCNGELKGVLSFKGNEGYDEVYTIHNCAGQWYNPVRWSIN